MSCSISLPGRFFSRAGAAAAAALWCAALPLPGSAQEAEVRRYETEIIVFALNDPRAAEGEFWTRIEDLRYPEPLQHLQAPPAADAGEEEREEQQTPAPADAAESSAPARLEPREGGVSEFADALENSEFYRVLLHWRWIQPIIVGGENPHIPLQGGREYGAHRELEGFLRLSHNRYLHLDADLWFSRYGKPGQEPEAPLPPPAPPVWPPEAGAFEKRSWNIAESLDRRVREEQPPALRTARLKQRRRMRSRELHYLDHPLFGMLIRLSPEEEKEARSQEAP